MCHILTDNDSERLLLWLTRTPGRELVDQERRYVDELFADLFGCYSLQLGWGRIFCAPTAKSQIRRHIILDACFSLMGGTGKVQGRPDAIPIASDSMAAVFLPHTLEFAAAPKQVLQETARVLVPGGHVILLGFNPWSMWGLCRLPRICSKDIPWCGRFIGSKQIARWLAWHGLEIEQQRSIMFLPPVRQASLLNRLRRVEPIIERVMPLHGAVYIIRAVKRVPTLTPLESLTVYDFRPLMVSAFKPTTRENLND